MGSAPLGWCDLGRVPYGEAWDLQVRLVAARRQGLVGDLLLLLEHPPVYTLGRAGRAYNIRVPVDWLRRQGAEVFEVDRGGDITFHGPGQLVGYPILDLTGWGRDLHRYLRNLEEVLIRALAAFGVTACRKAGYTGVWVRDRKIAAIGVKLNSGWITSHGFALNVATDLRWFGYIIPCGIRDYGVTSLSAELGRQIPREAAVRPVVDAFGEVFGRVPVRLEPGQLASLLADPALVAGGPTRPVGR